ncbi:MAG TPA: ATP-binding protein, partial [Acetobacteraceae bacterium]|nr:ATP-binding protein [Acetobacteraceae bacterium]
AHCTLRLLRLLRDRGETGVASATSELLLARDLRDQFRSLSLLQDQEDVACPKQLRAVAVNLVALFGRAIADIEIGTEIERLSLRGYQWRALVLAANELVANALLHGFAGRSRGRIDVSLRRLDRSRACLTVADDGVGFQSALPGPRGGVAGGLAKLLEADLTYHRTEGGGTLARIAFPYS